jgi:hypothetical protein
MSPSWDRSMILTGQQTQTGQSADRAACQGANLRTSVFVAAWIGLVTWCQPATAAVCHVPAAVLCDGCVGRLSIHVTPGGACRVSFTSVPSPESTGAVPFVDIDVEAEPPRMARHRVSGPRLSTTRTAPLRQSAGCFVFNGRRFCE